jgi:GntR family transcriptional regulator/MocR family aminotransferase
MTRGTTHLELAVTAGRAESGPLTAQIAGQLREALVDGRLATGERLPSTRALASLLGVSRTVVTAAYAQLFAEGWLEGRHGSGTYVADGAQARPGQPGQPGTAAPGPGPATTEPGRQPEHGGGGSRVAVNGSQATAEDLPGAAFPARTEPQRDDGPGMWGVSPPLGTGPLIELRPGIAWVAGIDRVAWRRAWRTAGTQPPSRSMNTRAARTCARLLPDTCAAAAACAAPRRRSS